MAVHKIKQMMILNMPAYVGMCILYLSKTLMYDFHYNYIQNRYPGVTSKLLFTETNSLTYQIQAEGVYKDFNEDKQMFDNSDYRRVLPFTSTATKR